MVYVSTAGGSPRLHPREREIVALLRERLRLRDDRGYEVVSALDAELVETGRRRVPRWAMGRVPLPD